MRRVWNLDQREIILGGKVNEWIDMIMVINRVIEFIRLLLILNLIDFESEKVKNREIVECRFVKFIWSFLDDTNSRVGEIIWWCSGREIFVHQHPCEWSEFWVQNLNNRIKLSCTTTIFSADSSISKQKEKKTQLLLIKKM